MTDPKSCFTAISGDKPNSPKPRHPKDFYATPPEVTEAFLQAEAV